MDGNQAQVFAPAAFSPQTAETYQKQSIADDGRIETMIHELENLELTQQQERDKRSRGLDDLPLTVISHGLPQTIPGMPDEVNQAYEAVWQEMQAEIAAMSMRGRPIMAEASGHNIHHDQPDLVVQEIQKMVEVLRS